MTTHRQFCENPTIVMLFNTYIIIQHHAFPQNMVTFFTHLQRLSLFFRGGTRLQNATGRTYRLASNRTTWVRHQILRILKAITLLGDDG